MRKLSIIVIAMLFIVLSFGCGNKETILRIGVNNMPLNLDPIKIYEYISNLINRNVFETFAVYRDGNYIPVLAKRWYMVDDNEFVIELKENIRFSCGTLITSEDILASIERALTHPNSRYVTTLGQWVQSYEIRNDSFIHIKHDSPYIMTFLNSIPIYNAKHLAQHDDEFLARNPLGTGKYYVASFDSNMIVLHKNRYHRYFKNIRRSPDKVKIKLEPSRERAYEMLITDNIDFLLNLPLSVYEEAFKRNMLQFFTISGDMYSFMMLDATSRVNPDINLPENPLRDKRVRQAIAHSIDMRSFISNQLNNMANILVIPATINLMGYPDNLEYYRYDIDYSRSLMAEAGHSKGFKMNIRIAESELSLALVEFIQESLREINIEVVIDNQDFNEFFYSLYTSVPAAFITGFHVQNTVRDIVPPLVDKFLYSDDGTISRFNIPNNRCEEIADLINVLIHVNELDMRRMAYYERLSELVHDQVFVIPFFQLKDLYVLNNRFNFNYYQDYLFSSFIKR